MREKIPEQTETSSQFEAKSKLINSTSLEKLVDQDETDEAHL